MDKNANHSLFRFLKKTFLFLLPVLVFYSFPVWVFFCAKEYYTSADVVRLQNENKDTLYRNVYNTGTFIPYKRLLVETNNPDVVVLGTSRSIQIRSDFFRDGVKFINAGLAARSVSDMKYFAKILPENKTVILVLDRNIFLKTPAEADAKSEDYDSFFGTHFALPFNVSRGVYLDYFLRHMYSLRDLVASASNRDKLGLEAFAHDNGFRSDGSYRNHVESLDAGLAAKVRADIAVLADSIRNAKDDFTFADNENIAPNLETLRETLRIFKLKGISVIGFVPPYPEAVNAATFAEGSLYKKRDTDLTNDLAKMFADIDGMQPRFSFYDLSGISLYGGSDDEFLDPVYGTDLLYARAVLYLAKNDATLKAYLDAGRLGTLIKGAKGNFLAF